MREIIVSEKDAGQRLNKYLMKYLKEAPSSFIYKMLRKKNIILNGVRAAGDEILSPGDNVKMFLAEDTIEKFRKPAGSAVAPGEVPLWAKKLNIAFETEDILICEKPAGVLSQKAKDTDYSLNEAVLYNLTQRGIVTKETLETFTPSVMNRLDRNTSGLVTYGITLKGSQALARELKAKTVEKYYSTIVYGAMLREIHSTAYIKKDESRNISLVINEPEAGARPIETIFTPVAISADRKYTELSVRLLTGKSHQIRANLQWLGYPMLGDTKYGDAEENEFLRRHCSLKRQLLHAGRMYFPKDTLFNEALEVTCELPYDYAAVREYLKLQEM